MKKTKSVKEEIAELKAQIINSGFKSLELFHTDPDYENLKVGTIYLVEGNERGFELYFIAEPKATPISGVDGIVTRIKMSFAEKTAFVERNMKEVNFSPRNIEAVFGHLSLKEFDELIGDENYPHMFEDLKLIVDYYHGKRLSKDLSKNSRFTPLKSSDFFYGLVGQYAIHETIYKTGINLAKVLKGQTYAGGEHLNEILFDFSKTKPHQILGISKNHLKKIKTAPQQLIENLFLTRGFRRKEASFDKEIISEAKELYIDMALRVQEEGLQELFEELDEKYSMNLKYVGIQTEESLSKNWSFIENVASFTGSSMVSNTLLKRIRERATSRLRDLCEKNNLNYKRAIEYFYYELRVRQGIVGTNYAVGLVEDYYRMQSKLLGLRDGITSRNMDKYPKNLKLQHDVATYNYNLIQNQIDEAKWLEAYENNKKYIWTDKDYCVVVPKTSNELIQEGAALNHCVGSYVQGVTDQKTTIVFLRKSKEPDVPLVTVEIRMQELAEGRKLAISQAYRNSNQPLLPEQTHALEKFAKAKDLVANYSR